ncbi:hypothetical protein [Streptomyces sp. NPDC048309]|uniref:hypothetical protein n=1 Tax=Streptomyces sp. NPDC048309 TaxID=3154618 RepID=UPI0033FA1E29
MRITARADHPVPAASEPALRQDGGPILSLLGERTTRMAYTGPVRYALRAAALTYSIRVHREGRHEEAESVGERQPGAAYRSRPVR